MFLRMSRHFWITVAVLVVATAIYYPFSPTGRQSRNMSLAHQHIAVLKPMLAADPQFAKVELNVTTAAGGALLVIGQVASQADVDAVHALVDRSHPPCPVAFQLRVLPASEPTTQLHE